MDFVSRARKAVFISQYLILFNDDFVEIRDVSNGRLCQVIAGQDIRCLDDAEGGFEKRNVVFSMAHPEGNG